jgi:signal peptidase I
MDVKTKNRIKLWEAASFSWLLPGLGQLFLGHYFAGFLFLVIYLVLFVPFILIFVSANLYIIPYFGIRWLLPVVSVLWILRYFSKIPAEIDINLSKPWCAVFLTLIWPGLGHFYIKKWVWGFFFLITAFIVHFIPKEGGIIKQLTIIFFWLFVCLHIYISFFSLKRLPWKKATSFLFSLFFVMFVTNVARPFFTGRYIVYVAIAKGDSMLPTIKPKDLLLVSRLNYYLTRPRTGDIVSLEAPESFLSLYKLSHSNEKVHLNKRIVAVGGDTVHIKNGKVYINDQLYKDYTEELNLDYDIVEDDRKFFHIINGEVYFDDIKLSIQANNVDQLEIERLNEKFKEEFGLLQYAIKEPYVVPENCFFVLGDNIYNSSDSRDFGAIPRDMIIGKVVLIRRW